MKYLILAMMLITGSNSFAAKAKEIGLTADGKCKGVLRDVGGVEKCFDRISLSTDKSKVTVLK